MNTLKMLPKIEVVGQDICKSPTIHVYANLAAGERCHAYIIDKYLSKLPSFAKEKVFYWQPWCGVSSDEESPWFVATPCGQNWLAKVVSQMFCEAGVAEKKN